VSAQGADADAGAGAGAKWASVIAIGLNSSFDLRPQHIPLDLSPLATDVTGAADDATDVAAAAAANTGTAGTAKAAVAVQQYVAWTGYGDATNVTLLGNGNSNSNSNSDSGFRAFADDTPVTLKACAFFDFQLVQFAPVLSIATTAAGAAATRTAAATATATMKAAAAAATTSSTKAVAFLGEPAKFVPVSVFRVASVGVSAASAQVEVRIRGDPGEVVELAFAQIELNGGGAGGAGTGAAAASVVAVKCTIGASGTSMVVAAADGPAKCAQ